MFTEILYKGSTVADKNTQAYNIIITDLYVSIYLYNMTTNFQQYPFSLLFLKVATPPPRIFDRWYICFIFFYFTDFRLTIEWITCSGNTSCFQCKYTLLSILVSAHDTSKLIHLVVPRVRFKTKVRPFVPAHSSVPSETVCIEKMSPKTKRSEVRCSPHALLFLFMVTNHFYIITQY